MDNPESILGARKDGRGTSERGREVRWKRETRGGPSDAKKRENHNSNSARLLISVYYEERNLLQSQGYRLTEKGYKAKKPLQPGLRGVRSGHSVPEKRTWLRSNKNKAQSFKGKGGRKKSLGQGGTRGAPQSVKSPKAGERRIVETRR